MNTLKPLHTVTDAEFKAFEDRMMAMMMEEESAPCWQNQVKDELYLMRSPAKEMVKGCSLALMTSDTDAIFRAGFNYGYELARSVAEGKN
jgi:hypothetical protein